MPGWIQILVFVLVAAAPAAGRLMQEISKKRAQQRLLDQKERDMLTGRNVRSTSQQSSGARLPGGGQSPATTSRLTPEQRAAQRQARLDEWRAAESKFRTQTGMQPRTGRSSSGPPFVVNEGQASSQTPDAESIVQERRRQAIERMRLEQQRQSLARQKQQTARLQQRITTSAAPTSRQPTTTHAGPHCDQPDTPGESIVHRLVKEEAGDQSADMRRVDPASRGRLIPAGIAAGGPIILTRNSLRQAFILKELLEPPIALREQDHLSAGQ